MQSRLFSPAYSKSVRNRYGSAVNIRNGIQILVRPNMTSTIVGCSISILHPYTLHHILLNSSQPIHLVNLQSPLCIFVDDFNVARGTTTRCKDAAYKSAKPVLKGNNECQDRILSARMDSKL
jgi:hypothetical protein